MGCETLRIEAAAHRLGISVQAAREAAERGEIPAVRIGRRWLVLKLALDRLLGGEAA